MRQTRQQKRTGVLGLQVDLGHDAEAFGPGVDAHVDPRVSCPDVHVFPEAEHRSDVGFGVLGIVDDVIVEDDTSTGIAGHEAREVHRSPLVRTLDHERTETDVPPSFRTDSEQQAGVIGAGLANPERRAIWVVQAVGELHVADLRSDSEEPPIARRTVLLLVFGRRGHRGLFIRRHRRSSENHGKNCDQTPMQAHGGLLSGCDVIPYDTCLVK